MSKPPFLLPPCQLTGRIGVMGVLEPMMGVPEPGLALVLA